MSSCELGSPDYQSCLGLSGALVALVREHPTHGTDLALVKALQLSQGYRPRTAAEVNTFDSSAWASSNSSSWFWESFVQVTSLLFSTILWESQIPAFFGFQEKSFSFSSISARFHSRTGPRRSIHVVSSLAHLARSHATTNQSFPAASSNSLWTHMSRGKCRRPCLLRVTSPC